MLRVESKYQDTSDFQDRERKPGDIFSHPDNPMILYRRGERRTVEVRVTGTSNCERTIRKTVIHEPTTVFHEKMSVRVSRNGR